MGGLFGGGGQTISNVEPRLGALNIQTSAYGLCVPIVYGTNRIPANLIDYADFTAIANTTTQTSGGKGGGGVTSSNTTYTYTTAVALGLCEGPIAGIGNIWAGKKQIVLADIGATLFSGSYAQSAWGYMATKHPGNDLNYRGFAYIAAPAYPLGGSAQLPDHSFEVKGILRYGAQNDANPKDIISDFLTNSNYGAGFPAAKLGNLTQFSNYCLAAGLLFSPAYNEQNAAQQVITDLAQAANIGIVWSEGVLKFVPYGDTAITGALGSFTPNITPAYDLTDDDFLGDASQDPVIVTRKSQADAFNQVQVEFLNRANQYNIEIVTAQDQSNVDLYGLRQLPPLKMHFICDIVMARFVAQLVLQRNLYIRNTYEFKLGWKYALLEPMDLVTLTDAALGLNQSAVRIISIEEDEAGVLSMVAEEFPAGIAHAAAYGNQASAGYNTNYNVAPGNSNTPVIFDAPAILTASGYEIWTAVSGGAEWGGCNVWVSTDNATFKQAGSIAGAARHGVISTNLALGVDPDTSSTLGINLTLSGGSLSGGTQADADALNTLFWLEGELLSYQNAALTAANQYNLTYLRRRIYNSKKIAHVIGERFVRLDQAIFKYAYDPKLLGKQVWLKFVSFNRYGGGIQDIASVPAYSYTIGGSISAPGNPLGFTCSQNKNVVVFQWNQLPDPNVVGFDIRYNPLGVTDWAGATPITQVTKGTQITTARVPPGNWTFLLAARDNGGVYSVTPARADLKVLNTFNLISGIEQSPNWLGTITNMVVHWTGVILPKSQNLANADGWATFDTFVVNPYALCYYEAAEIDIGFDSANRVWGDIRSYLPVTSRGLANPTLQIDNRLNAASYTGFYYWTIGAITARFVKQRMVIDTSIGVPVVSGFNPIVDAEEYKLSGTDTIGSSGTAVSFSAPFHFVPTVGATATGAVGLIATVTSVTVSGFTAHVFNTSGAEVGGIITWDATGA